MRLAADVDGTVRADPLARRPGRGAYVCRRPTCVDDLLRRRPGRVAQALRLAAAGVSVDEESLRIATRGRSSDEQTTAGRCASGRATPAA